MNYNPQIHHRRSIRLKAYDYSQAGLYFITICVQDKLYLFGKVEKGEMVLNEYGKIAYNEWLKTPEIRNNVELDVFVVMPNHIHGIIILTDARRGELHSPVNTHELHSPVNTHELHSSVNTNLLKTFYKMGECKSPLRAPSNNIGAIVRGYKSAVTKQLNLLNIGCTVWQRNYYEHIIRNEQSYYAISEYIINNPAKWNNDKFYT